MQATNVCTVWQISKFYLSLVEQSKKILECFLSDCCRADGYNYGKQQIKNEGEVEEGRHTGAEDKIRFQDHCLTNLFDMYNFFDELFSLIVTLHQRAHLYTFLSRCIVLPVVLIHSDAVRGIMHRVILAVPIIRQPGCLVYFVGFFSNLYFEQFWGVFLHLERDFHGFLKK